jgi:BCD family chlorophyll transporter-like MFS transporter
MSYETNTTVEALARELRAATRVLVTTHQKPDGDALGSVLAHAGTGYSFVYHFEMCLLFTTLIAIGPLVRPSRRAPAPSSSSKFGLPVLPG